MEESTESTNPLYESLKKRGIQPTSLALYWRNLRLLNGNKEPTNMNFLKKVSSTMDKIKDKKPTTQRNYIITVCSLLKNEPSMKKLYDKYYAILCNYNKELATRNTMSETQKDNWLSQDEVKYRYNELTNHVKPLLSKRKLTATEYSQLLDWVVLSLYVLQKPRRNKDYALCYIVKTLPADMDMSKNYYCIKTNAFYFNNYKTANTYRTQEVKCSPEMAEVIRAFLKFHPLRKVGETPLLANYEGQPFTETNKITKILNRIFHKKIGASMLRNIYLTDKYGNKMQQLQQDASDMGTSSNTVAQQYVKLTDA